MADDSELQPGQLEPGDVNVSAGGTQTAVMPDRSVIMRGAIPRPAGAFPSPALPPWMPTPQQIAAQKQQEEQEFEMKKLQSQLQGLPFDQAQRATVAAMKLQGQRGYQSDLNAGKPAHEALAKWAPMMFYDRPQTFAGALRTSFTAPKPAPQWVPPNKETGAPGHFESSTGAIHVPPAQSQTGEAKWMPPDPATGAPGHFATRSGGVMVPRTPPAQQPGQLSPVERDHLRFAEREFDKLQKAQDEDVDGKRAIGKAETDQTPGQKAAAAARADRQIRMSALQRTIDGYHSRVDKAAQPPPVAKPPIPLPSKKSELTVGQPYVTKKGVYMWTGEKLREVQQKP